MMKPYFVVHILKNLIGSNSLVLISFQGLLNRHSGGATGGVGDISPLEYFPAPSPFSPKIILNVLNKPNLLILA